MEGPAKADTSAARFEIYRAAEARDYAEDGVIDMGDLSPVAAEGLTHFHRMGDGDGQRVQMLYAAPGVSLSLVWFKSGYPLPLHSHTGDCLYHIVGGSIRVGHEVLGVGDGFFVGSGVPYTYTPGPEGCEVLEFRHTDKIDIHFKNSRKAWEKAVESLAARRDAWRREVPPRQAAAAE